MGNATSAGGEDELQGQNLVSEGVGVAQLVLSTWS